MTTSRTFTCDRCRRVFESEWSDAEALDEYKQNYGVGDEPPGICMR